MDERKIIQLDNVTIKREADGNVTIIPKADRGFVSIALLIACIVVALVCGAGMVVSGVIQLFNSEGENPIGLIIFGLFAMAMFGSMSFFLIGQSQSGKQLEQITISPITNMVKIGERVISFNEIESVFANESPSAVVRMEGVSVAQFALALTDGTLIPIGSLAAGHNQMEKKRSEIISVLNKTLRKD